MNGKRLAKSILTVVGFILAVVAMVLVSAWLGIPETFWYIVLVIANAVPLVAIVYITIETWEEK